MFQKIDVVHLAVQKRLVCVDCQPETQCIISLTGFNIQIRDGMKVIQEGVSHLPTINAPAPEMSTVTEVLTWSVRVLCAINKYGENIDDLASIL